MSPREVWRARVYRAMGRGALIVASAAILLGMLMPISNADAQARHKAVDLIIGFAPGVDIPAVLNPAARAPRVDNLALEADLTAIEAMDYGIRPLFTASLPAVAHQDVGRRSTAARLRRWAVIRIPDSDNADSALAELRSMPSVVAAYRRPVAYPADISVSPAAKLPRYVSKQDYLDPAPDGVGAKKAWKLGANGKSVTIADIEGDWVTKHRDLRAAGSVAIDGIRAASSLWYDHGTAELGLVIGTRNKFGITGIAWSADILLYSIYRERNEDGTLVDNVADAILQAAAKLKPGDIIFLPIEFRDDFAPGRGFAVEYYLDIFDAVRYATDLGIVVLEAAGNGGLNLDSPLFGDAFNTSVRGDSGAILVGAGGVPDYHNLERLSFSSYGVRVNVQNWGHGVVTTGYGDLFSRNDLTTYTANFNGTSSATGITVGVVAALQGYARKILGRSLTSREMRGLLVKTGTPQKKVNSRHIGPRPDMEKALAELQIMSQN